MFYCLLDFNFFQGFLSDPYVNSTFDGSKNELKTNLGELKKTLGSLQKKGTFGFVCLKRIFNQEPFLLCYCYKIFDTTDKYGRPTIAYFLFSIFLSKGENFQSYDNIKNYLNRILGSIEHVNQQKIKEIFDHVCNEIPQNFVVDNSTLTFNENESFFDEKDKNFINAMANWMSSNRYLNEFLQNNKPKIISSEPEINSESDPLLDTESERIKSHSNSSIYDHEFSDKSTQNKNRLILILCVLNCMFLVSFVVITYIFYDQLRIYNKNNENKLEIFTVDLKNKIMEKFSDEFISSLQRSFNKVITSEETKKLFSNWINSFFINHNKLNENVFASIFSDSVNSYLNKPEILEAIKNKIASSIESQEIADDFSNYMKNKDFSTPFIELLTVKLFDSFDQKSLESFESSVLDDTKYTSEILTIIDNFFKKEAVSTSISTSISDNIKNEKFSSVLATTLATVILDENTIKQIRSSMLPFNPTCLDKIKKQYSCLNVGNAKKKVGEIISTKDIPILSSTQELSLKAVGGGYMISITGLDSFCMPDEEIKTLLTCIMSSSIH